MAGELLRYTHKISAQDCRNAWLRDISIKAGNLAEEDLAYVPVMAELLKVDDSEEGLFGQLSTIRVRLGSMEIKLVIDHARSVESDQPSVIDEYFTEAYRKRSCHIGGITLDDNQEIIEGCLSFLDENNRKLEGVMGDYPNSLMAIEILTTFAQLAQFMIYRIDNLQREQANNLWMRSVVIHNPYPIMPRMKQRLKLHCRQRSLIEMKGET